MPAALVFVTFALASAARVSTASPTPPQLEIDAPEALRPVAARLRQLDADRLAAVMRLVGIEGPTDPVRVILAPDDSNLARGTPGWIAGYAESARGVVVIFPQRTPSYPDESLEEVLQHEVAHVLVARAARGRPVPRWFHEGLATAAERVWGLEDRSRLILELVRGQRITLEELDARFLRDRASSGRAYILAGAFVRELVERHGPDLPRRLLAATASDVPFREAFEWVTGESLRDAEDIFWSRRRFWTDWAMFLTSSTVIWMIVTVLALYAFKKRREQRAAHRAQWTEEGGDRLVQGGDEDR